MSSEIAVALIGGVGALAGSFFGILANGKMTNYRLQELEKKVDKHNGLIERMYKTETDIEVLEEQMKVANHRIKDLEGAQ